MISPSTLRRSRRRPAPVRERPVSLAIPEELRLSAPRQLLPSWEKGPDGLVCRWRLG